MNPLRDDQIQFGRHMAVQNKQIAAILQQQTSQHSQCPDYISCLDSNPGLPLRLNCIYTRSGCLLTHHLNKSKKYTDLTSTYNTS